MIFFFFFLEKRTPSVETCHLGSLQDSGNQLRVGSLQDVCADEWKFWISDLGFFMKD